MSLDWWAIEILIGSGLIRYIEPCRSFNKDLRPITLRVFIKENKSSIFLMDQVKDMMASLKRQREEAKIAAMKKSHGGGYDATKKKYIRRGEIEAALEEEELQQEQSTRQTTTSMDDKESLEATISSSSIETVVQKNNKNSGSSSLSSIVAEDSKNHNTLKLTVSEAKKQLRQLGHPVTLFGESHDGRQQRLGAILHQGGGRHSEMHHYVESHAYQTQEAEEKEDVDEETEMMNDADDNEAGDATNHVMRDERTVYRFFKEMLRSWEHALGQRPEAVKRTAQGKIATKTMKQCKDYIRPLFRLCKNRDVPPDVLANLVAIVRFCQVREASSCRIRTYVYRPIGSEGKHKTFIAMSMMMMHACMTW
jgi:pre-mRNA-splicing factor 18